MKRVFLILGSVLAIFIAGKNGQSWIISRSDLPTFSSTNLQAGDLIFIRGNSWRSLLVLLTEQEEKEYSHVGLIVPDSSSWAIIHATPTQKGKRVDKVVKESLEDFLSPEEVSQVGIFRIRDSVDNNKNQLVKQAETYWQNATPFDHEFDCSTREAVYCTELIWRIFHKSGQELVGEWGNDLLLPSDLMGSSLLKEVGHYKNYFENKR